MKSDERIFQSYRVNSREILFWIIEYNLIVSNVKDYTIFLVTRTNLLNQRLGSIVKG